MRWITVSCLALVLAGVLCVPATGAQDSGYGKILQVHLSPQGGGYEVSHVEVRYGEAPHLEIRSGNLKGIVRDGNGKELQSFTFPEPGTILGDFLGLGGENSLTGFTAHAPHSDMTVTFPYRQGMQQFTLTDTMTGNVPARTDLHGPFALFCTGYSQDPDCLALQTPPQTPIPDSMPCLYTGLLLAIALIIASGFFVRQGIAAGHRAGYAHL